MQGWGYDAVSVREVGLKGKSDEQIISWLQKQKRIIITGDLDFGEFFYLKSFGEIGVIILKVKSQGLRAQIEIIEYLHQERILKDKRLSKSLIVAQEGRYRWRRVVSD